MKTGIFPDTDKKLSAAASVVTRASGASGRLYLHIFQMPLRDFLLFLQMLILL